MTLIVQIIFKLFYPPKLLPKYIQAINNSLKSNNNLNDQCHRGRLTPYSALYILGIIQQITENKTELDKLKALGKDIKLDDAVINRIFTRKKYINNKELVAPDPYLEINRLLKEKLFLLNAVSSMRIGNS